MRFSIAVLVLAICLGWTNAAYALEADMVPVMPIKYTLTVNVNGLGTVESNPAGINCSDSGGTCSASFIINTVVALLATPPPADEFGTYYFGDWGGDASGTIAAAAVTMGGTRNVDANFTALGIPIAVTELPAGQDAVYYDPVPDTVAVPPIANCRPIAIDNTTANAVATVELPPFDQNVDVYIGIELDGYNDFIVFGPSALQSINAGLLLWRQNLNTSVQDTLFDIPRAAFPAGTYHLYLMVTAVGDMTNSYLWETYFEVTHMIPLNPFVP
jgi:hypothetical protein